jgi:hypothetical protein
MSTPDNGIRRDLPDDEDILLLPWLETGKLDDAARDRLLARLGEDDVLAAEMREVDAEAFAAISANEALGAPSPVVLDRLMESIGREKQPQTLRARLGGMLGGLGAAGFNPGFMRLAGAAAALVIVLQAGVIGALLLQQQPASRTYETASAERPAAETHLVRFAEEARLPFITALLAEAGARMEGPLPGGFYRIIVDAPRAAGEAGVVERLKRDELVTVVLPWR